MYNIICCIIFGFFTLLGISNTIYFLIECFFKFDDSHKKELTAENAEYILRSLKYRKLDYKITTKCNGNKELKFIKNKFYQ